MPNQISESIKFIESIKVMGGQALNLNWHQKRINKTFQEFFSKNIKPNLYTEVNNFLKSAELKEEKVYKLKIVYGCQSFEVQISEYIPKTITNIKLIEVADYDYSYKYFNRSFMEDLLASNQEADELILLKNGYLTDSSYSNLVFHKNNQLFTPNTYLLNGTKRQQLIADGRVRETIITQKKFQEYETVSLINAMLEPGELVLDVGSIIR